MVRICKEQQGPSINKTQLKGGGGGGGGGTYVFKVTLYKIHFKSDIFNIVYLNMCTSIWIVYPPKKKSLPVRSLSFFKISLTHTCLEQVESGDDDKY